jgi:hypothetical protein
LVNATVAYVESVFYPGGTSAQIGIELNSIARTAINSYVNNLVMGGQAGYNSSQFRFIEMLIGNSFTSNLPLVSLTDRIADVEDNLTDNQLTVPEQTPLLLATTIGTNTDAYWTAPATGWNTYTGPPPALSSARYVNIAYWDAAAMNGALAGYAATPDGMVEPSINYVTNKMVSALIGALVCTAGKVIFNWIPRIQHMNSSLSTMMMGGGVRMGGGGRFGAVNRGGGNPHGGGPKTEIIMNGSWSFSNPGGGTTTLYDFYDSSTSGPGGADQQCEYCFGQASMD